MYKVEKVYKNPLSDKIEYAYAKNIDTNETIRVHYKSLVGLITQGNCYNASFSYNKNIVSTIEPFEIHPSLTTKEDISETLPKINSQIIFHGTKEPDLIPTYGKGSESTDYGQGFYTSTDIELAKEWACSYGEGTGYVYGYELDMSDLNVLYLDETFTILEWITLLSEHRTLNNLSTEGKDASDFLVNNFSVDISNVDVIMGYRADDSYFTFALDFLNNTISVEKLTKAMFLGQLGLQTVIKSQKAFDRLKQISVLKLTPGEMKTYTNKANTRRSHADNAYRRLKTENPFQGTYLYPFISEYQKILVA